MFMPMRRIHRLARTAHPQKTGMLIDRRLYMPVEIRTATDQDVAAMAAIRAKVWGTEAFWRGRIGRYLTGEHSPQHAQAARQIFVAVEDGAVLGFVAGHRTSRFGFDGELQWIDVVQDRRRSGIAGVLIRKIAVWFVQQSAFRVCVNVAEENFAARGLYAKHGAQPLSEQWLVWDDIRVTLAHVDDAH
jgi:GNAT superfamily N-acetyltransferase